MLEVVPVVNIGVHVPAAAGDFDAADIVLNQSASQQATLTERIPSVAISVRVLFFLQVEGLQFTAGQKCCRFCVKIGIGLNATLLESISELLVEGVDQFHAFTERIGSQIGWRCCVFKAAIRITNWQRTEGWIKEPGSRMSSRADQNGVRQRFALSPLWLPPGE